jgi:hypothetical protein
MQKLLKRETRRLTLGISFEGGLQVNISNLEKLNTIFSHCGEEDCSLSSFFEAFSWKVT